MKKSNEQILIKKGYTFIKDNPETGWSQIQIDEGNGQFTAFWVPNQLIGDLMNGHYFEEAIASLQNARNKEYEQLEMLRNYKKKVDTQIQELKNKTDSQRKSISYYKGERDALQYRITKISTDFKNRQTEYKEKIQRFSAALDSIEAESIRKSEEIDMLQHRNRVLITVTGFITVIFCSALIILAI
jgi:uncharacterized coiled-coil DUF342 family protein